VKAGHGRGRVVGLPVALTGWTTLEGRCPVVDCRLASRVAEKLGSEELLEAAGSVKPGTLLEVAGCVGSENGP
jgi:hypothetical protein